MAQGPVATGRVIFLGEKIYDEYRVIIYYVTCDLRSLNTQLRA